MRDIDDMNNISLASSKTFVLLDEAVEAKKKAALSAPIADCTNCTRKSKDTRYIMGVYIIIYTAVYSRDTYK